MPQLIYTLALGWAQVQPFSFIPSDLSRAPFLAHGTLPSGAVGGDAVALTVPVAPHRLWLGARRELISR
jgi:hypothetical protein